MTEASVMRISTYLGVIDCPCCGAEVSGWLIDPRGAKDVVCDECGETFDVPENIEIKLE